MAYDVIETDSATEDIGEILAYIAVTLENPAAATQFADHLQAVYDQLADYPLAFESSRDPQLALRGYRKFLVGNYVGLYLVDDKAREVQIARMFYGRRDYAKYL